MAIQRRDALLHRHVIKDDLILTVGKQNFALLTDNIARDLTIQNLLVSDVVQRA